MYDENFTYTVHIQGVPMVTDIRPVATIWPLGNEHESWASWARTDTIVHVIHKLPSWYEYQRAFVFSPTDMKILRRWRKWIRFTLFRNTSRRSRVSWGLTLVVIDINKIELDIKIRYLFLPLKTIFQLIIIWRIILFSVELWQIKGKALTTGLSRTT